MALNRESLIELAKASARASLTPNTSFKFGNESLSAEALNATFTKELNELGATPQLFRENANLIYTLMEVGLTEVLPPRVLSAYGQFADVQTVPFGAKPVFKLRVSDASKQRAKQFITKVGAAGRYEVFKLDGYEMTIPTSIHGGAARIEWEEILTGKFQMSDYYNLVLEGLDEDIYKEIANALKATVDGIKPVNKTTQSTFNEQEMDRLLMTADVYGKSTIYCTFEFAATMKPDKDWASNEMKNTLWTNGAFTTYKGHNVIILPQSFTDDTNATKVIDPSLAYIIPTGASKPVHVAFEGSAQVKQFENRDWSSEIQTYQRVGVGTYLLNPGICVYENSSLTMENEPANSVVIGPTSSVAPIGG